MKYMLDTHTWIWWNMNPQKLSHKVKSIISDASHYNELLLCAISLWEFCKLLEKKRLAISCAPEDWIDQALDIPKLRLVPLSPTICYRSTILPPPFHDDPADQIIAASARYECATLLTKDRRILDYQGISALW